LERDPYLWNGDTMLRKIPRVLAAFATRKISFDLDLVPLHLKNLPLRKIANWLLTESSVAFKPARPWGFPTILQVEPTSRCNLRCRICPVGTGLHRPSGNMGLEMFQNILDQIGKYLLVLMFWDWGEPFLNPDAYAMIQYARRAGVRVVCSTNGHVFAKGEEARRVVSSGLDVLVFSVDGITQQTYQTNRTLGNLETVVKGIRNVVEEKRRLRSATPVVNLRFIVMKHCEHEVPQLKQYARSLGVDVLTLRKFHFVPGTETGVSDRAQGMARPGSLERLVPSEMKFRQPALPDGSLTPVRVAENPCRNLWNCPSIHWDGTVCSCFADYDGRRPLGSLRTQRFQEIWYGEAYRRLRRGFRKSWQDSAFCGKCASGYQGGDVGRQANAEAIFFPSTGDSERGAPA
jgi:MoaA/NifB/PqqE/SkfB family radical SAM enzyme